MEESRIEWILVPQFWKQDCNFLAHSLNSEQSEIFFAAFEKVVNSHYQMFPNKQIHYTNDILEKLTVA